MPPKKIKNKTETTEIVNMYERMPKHFLNTANNPNFKLHHLKIPFRMCVVAPSGSGKTNFIVNLLKITGSGEGTFSTVTIITQNKDEPLYNFISSQSDRIIIKEGLNNTPKLDDYDKDFNHLLIWDDLVLSKDLTMVTNYYIRARKLNVSVVFLSQSFFLIPKTIRINSNYLILLRVGSDKDLRLILSNYGLGISMEHLVEIYNYATSEKLQPLLIDMEAPLNEKFRKGFNEIITIEDYDEI